MVINVEYVFIDNIIMNIVILYLTNLIIHNEYKKSRIVLASTIGAVLALIFPLLVINPIITLILKILSGIVISIIAFNPKNVKLIVLNFAIFLSITAVLGGLALGVVYMLSKSKDIFSLNYNIKIPMGCVYGILLIYIIIMKNAIKHFYSKKSIFQFQFIVKLKNNKKSLIAKAFLDSGNSLVDPITNKPVIVLGYKVFANLFSSISMEKILLRKVDAKDIADCHYIDYGTVSENSQKMLVFSIDEIEIKLDKETKRLNNAICGLSLTKFDKSLNCDMLLNPKCL